MSMSFEFPYPSQRMPVMARNMVATSQPLASQAGVRMLLQGGNAIDAALATAIALTVVEPTGNGLGSDAFAILHDGNELHGLNASGRAPAAWTPERFAGQDAMPERGWDSVTVPGAVSAWVSLSERFGRLPFEALFEPAITYAEKGYAVSPIIAQLWANGAKVLKEQPGFAEAFMPEGRAPKAGELYSNAAMGRSLRLIAETRGQAFYRGELAEKMAAFAGRHGGALSVEDLASHEPFWCGTVSKDYHGVEAHEIPPNGQGIAALIALGILEHTAVCDHGVDSVAGLHLQIEAMKLALAEVYAHVGDPETMEIPPEQMLEPDYLKARAKEIDPKRAGDPGHAIPRPGGTVYITAADASGSMVSFIQSNYSGFGSGVVVPETGISLQNRGSGFRLDANHPNCVGPRKLPFHTIIPGFLTRGGEPLTSYGVMGGPMQAQGHVQMVLRMLDYGQTPQTASDAPRWRVTGGRRVAMEQSFPAETLEGLKTMGHEISVEPPEAAFGFGGAQLIHRMDNGIYIAGSDHRKDGQAVGF
ncbi:gamma-glutamyltransferase family protein [Fodinicurvata sediminis]|uniref:gamma-glutamyltransferase family protein n=1 Tax=Fodinicurvata sediminis TaxID=1121832 RepID=UPI0003B509BD|nr:gamma-glutamyltransferase family protein [Fodinicurvata sediminis]